VSSIVQKAREVVRRASGPTFAEKIAYFRAEGRKVSVGAMMAHVGRQAPGKEKGRLHVPGHLIEWTKTVEDRRTGEPKQHTWTTKTCVPEVWAEAADLTVRLVAIAS
jgi:mannose/cellobiose epimerase-like protein (N-acyl-D-glucosamine 2-epimerase family)